MCRQELRVSPIFHTFNKRHVKHETATFLKGSEFLSVVEGARRSGYLRYESSCNTCRALDTIGPNYVGLPPPLDQLFSLTGQGNNQSHLK